MTELLAEPFTLYQAGFDASWELDLWGRVRRSVEAADADVGQQAALLDLARLSLASDVTRNYFELRTAQRQIRLMREDIVALAKPVMRHRLLLSFAAEAEQVSADDVIAALLRGVPLAA